MISTLQGNDYGKAFLAKYQRQSRLYRGCAGPLLASAIALGVITYLGCMGDLSWLHLQMSPTVGVVGTVTFQFGLSAVALAWRTHAIATKDEKAKKALKELHAKLKKESDDLIEIGSSNVNTLGEFAKQHPKNALAGRVLEKAENLHSLSNLLIATSLVVGVCFAGYVGITAWQHGGTLPWTWSVYAITGGGVLALGIMGAFGHRHARKLPKTPLNEYQQTEFFSAYLRRPDGKNKEEIEALEELCPDFKGLP